MEVLGVWNRDILIFQQLEKLFYNVKMLICCLFHARHGLLSQNIIYEIFAYLLLVNTVYSRHISCFTDEIKLMFVTHTNKTLVRTCVNQRHQNRCLSNSHFLYNNKQRVTWKSVNKRFHVSFFTSAVIPNTSAGNGAYFQLYFASVYA